ncbi:MAG TPA: TonB-dependent receptor, partial [Thermoanaerobaculia bacterium]|nr:TonB-dependent receptor [Thermoanaerobaculia bacterium]
NQAIGGLVGLIPRTISGDAGDAEISYGSYGTARASGYAQTMLSPNVGIAATAQWFQTDGFVKAADGDRGLVDIPSSARNALGALAAEWTGDSGARARLRGETFRESFSLGTPDSREDRTISDVAAEGDVPTGASSALHLSGFFQHQQLSFANVAFIGSGRNDEFRANTHADPIQALGGSAMWTHASGSALSLLAVGLDAQQNRGEDRATNFSSAGAVTQLANAGGEQLFSGAFVEATLDLSPRWHVLANARVDSWRNSGGHLETEPGDATDYAPETKSHFDPRLAVRYEATPALALRAAGYRGFRAPYIRELYYGALAKTMLSLPNPELGPESATGGEFGADLTLGRVQLQTTAFRTAIDDMIGTVTTQSTPIRIVKIFNVGTGRSQGVETALGWAPSPAFHFQATYAYTDARVTSSDLDPTIPGSHIPYVPRHLLTGSVAVRIPLAGTLAVDGRSQSVTYLDAANRLRLDPSTVFDAALTTDIVAGIQTRLAVTNIFDRRYVADVTVGRQIGDPCEVTLAVRWSFAAAPAH